MFLSQISWGLCSVDQPNIHNSLWLVNLSPIKFGLDSIRWSLDPFYGLCVNPVEPPSEWLNGYWLNRFGSNLNNRQILLGHAIVIPPSLISLIMKFLVQNTDPCIQNHDVYRKRKNKRKYHRKAWSIKYVIFYYEQNYKKDLTFSSRIKNLTKNQKISHTNS